MNHFKQLRKTPDVAIAEFFHPAGEEHTDPAREKADSFSINFVEAGDFEILIGRSAWYASPTTVFVTRPGLTFRCRHRTSWPTDVCLAIDYADAPLPSKVLKEIPPVVQMSNRFRYQGVRMRRALAAGNSLAIDEISCELVQSLEQDSTHVQSPPFRQSQLRWYGERIERVREILEGEFPQKHSLGDLAKHAGMSRFHFARIFRELVGVPMRQYLLSVRIAKACEYLDAGMKATEACYAVGFDNFAHFSRSFSRRTGACPSKWRHKAFLTELRSKPPLPTFR